MKNNEQTKPARKVIAPKIQERIEFELHTFDTVGDSFEGRLEHLVQIPTKFDKAKSKISGVEQKSTIAVFEDGSGVFLSAFLLSSYDWTELIGKIIGMEFTGKKDTPNGTMKVFEVWEVEETGA